MSHRILLVEDNDADALLVQRMLRTTVEDAMSLQRVARLADAVSVLHAEHCDAALLDLSLPDSRGLDTVQALRAADATLPIVVLSGLDDEEVAIQAMQSGAQDYLVKHQGDGKLVARAIRYAIERKRLEDKLTYLALHDPLTGIGNRSLFRDHLQQAIIRASRSGKHMAVLYLDLDGFKGINDTLGHDVGDHILKVVAGRLQQCIRASDTVARMGGDEFTVVLERLKGKDCAHAAARKVLEALRLPVDVDGHTLRVTPSIGVAVRAEHGRDAETLTKNADKAMYQVKAMGGNNYRIYANEVEFAATLQLATTAHLHEAIERRKFLSRVLASN